MEVYFGKKPKYNSRGEVYSENSGTVQYSKLCCCNDRAGSKGIWTVPTQKMEIEESGGRHVNAKGMGVIVTGLFIVGEMAGGGILAMPRAMENACTVYYV